MCSFSPFLNPSCNWKQKWERQINHLKKSELLYKIVLNTCTHSMLSPGVFLDSQKKHIVLESFRWRKKITGSCTRTKSTCTQLRPVHAKILQILTSHGGFGIKCFAGVEHKSTDENYLLRTCDVKICIAFTFAGSMKQAYLISRPQI